MIPQHLRSNKRILSLSIHIDDSCSSHIESIQCTNRSEIVVCLLHTSSTDLIPLKHVH